MQPLKDRRVRRARALVVFLKESQALLFNFLSKQAFTCNLLCIELLLSLDDWHDGDKVPLPFASALTPELADQQIDDLLACGALVEEGSPAAMKDETYDSVWQWGMVPGIYHFGIKDTPFAEAENIPNYMAERNALAPSPALFTTNDSFESVVALPPFKRDQEFFKTILARRSRREYLPDPISQQALADCLFAGMGITAIEDIPLFGKLPLKTTPSGGARNPYEAYIYVRAVEGLQRGIYHYSAREHTLGLVSSSDVPLPHDMLGHQQWCDQAAAIVFLVAHFDRTMWKYASPIAYRVVLIEAGHIGQNMVLAATLAGLASATTSAVADSVVERALNLTQMTQSAVYAILLGKPDPGVSTGSKADGDQMIW